MNNSLFGDLDDFTSWKQEWKDMPEFEQDDTNPFLTIEVNFGYLRSDGLPQTRLKPYRILKVHFRNREDVYDFANLLNIKGLTPQIKSFWYGESVETFSGLIKQKVTRKTLGLWYPQYNLEKPSNFLYMGGGYNP